MDKVLDVAGYIVRRYREISGEDLKEMKLHKLLYFTQREAFAVTGEPAFEGTFEGWKHGPVCPEIRVAYYRGEMVVPFQEISAKVQYIANNVILGYGAMAVWKLDEMVQQENSWRNAREGLSPAENGHSPLLLEDIREDAKNVRPYDYVWEMYYDELQEQFPQDGENLT